MFFVFELLEMGGGPYGDPPAFESEKSEKIGEKSAYQFPSRSLCRDGVGKQ